MSIDSTDCITKLTFFYVCFHMKCQSFISENDLSQLVQLHGRFPKWVLIHLFKFLSAENDLSQIAQL